MMRAPVESTSVRAGGTGRSYRPIDLSSRLLLPARRGGPSGAAGGEGRRLAFLPVEESWPGPGHHGARKLAGGQRPGALMARARWSGAAAPYGPDTYRQVGVSGVEFPG